MKITKKEFQQMVREGYSEMKNSLIKEFHADQDVNKEAFEIAQKLVKIIETRAVGIGADPSDLLNKVIGQAKLLNKGGVKK